MRATLYLPYAIGDPVKGFKYDDPNFTTRKYIEIMTADYKKYKDSVNNIVSNNYDRRRDVFNRGLVFASSNKIKREYIKQEYQYNSCGCIIRGMHGEDVTIDNMIDFYKSGEQFILNMKLLNVSKNPDLETEIKMWLKESNHINFSDLLSEEEKIFNLPKKDIKVTFTDAKSTAILKECKILEYYTASEYAILVKNIIFIVDK